MALTNPASIIYNFERDYDTLDDIVVPIKVKNVSLFDEDVQTLSAYAANLDTLLIYPSFDTVYSGLSSSPHADNYRYFLDLGDGTISDSLTARHSYALPGDYRITLVVADSAHNFYRSVDRPILKIRNPIEDSLHMTYKNANSARSSTFENPIIVTRFNSYQSYRGVSANGGYTINLAVSGNKQPFVNSDSFYKDPYLHLKSFATFVSATKGGFEAITSLKTSNTFIYARRKRLTPAAGIEYFNEPRAGTVFVGTSGTAEIYYYED